MTLKSIANNAEIDVIYEKWQAELEPLRAQLNGGAREKNGRMGNPARGRGRVAARGEGATRAMVGGPHRSPEGNGRLDRGKGRHSIALRPALRGKDQGSRHRPFTVESLSPHRVDAGDEEELIDTHRRGLGRDAGLKVAARPTSPKWYLNISQHGWESTRRRSATRSASVLEPWPGEYVGAEGRFIEGGDESAAPRSIGPEFGTLSRVDLVAAAREADARFDALIACAFAFDAHASEVSKLGRSRY